LAALLKDDEEQRGWQTYVADAACRIVHELNKRSTAPYYSDMISRQKQVDTRSGQEIVDSIVNRRRKKRGGEKT
jgi:hypothetical protein